MNNTTTLDTAVQDSVGAFTIVKILILIATILGNLFVILTIRQFRRMRTALNFLILNLSVCDIMLVSFSIPTSIILEQNQSRGYIFGPVGCKLLYPLATLASNSAVFSLLCITVERYMAIKNPLKWGYRKRHVRIFICLTYTCALASVLPYAVFLKYEISDKGIPQCLEKWSHTSKKGYTIVLFLLQYGVPLPVMVILYTKAWISLKRNNDKAIKLSNEQRRSRGMSIADDQIEELQKRHERETQHGFRKVITYLWRCLFELKFFHKCRKRNQTGIDIIVEDMEGETDIAQTRRQQNIRTFIMFFFIVLLFAVCSLPNQILWLWTSFFKNQSAQLSLIMKELFLILHYSNCVLNPWIYGGLNRTFRKGYKKLITCTNAHRENSAMIRDSIVLSAPSDNDLFKDGIITQRPVSFIECGSIDSILKEPVDDEWNKSKKNIRVKFKLSLASFTNKGSHEKEMRKLSINLSVDRQQTLHASSEKCHSWKSSMTTLKKCENKKEFLTVLPPTSCSNVSGTKLFPTIFSKNTTSNRSRRKSEHAFKSINEQDNFKMYGLLDVPLLRSDNLFSETEPQRNIIPKICETEDVQDMLQVHVTSACRENAQDELSQDQRGCTKTSSEDNVTPGSILNKGEAGNEVEKADNISCVVAGRLKASPKYVRPQVPNWTSQNDHLHHDPHTNYRLPYNLELFKMAKESYI